jgi:hypothetical protein
MEQERHERQGNRRNLDHLKRGDQQSVGTETDQADGSEDSGNNDQNRLDEERCANRLEDTPFELG